MRILCVEGDEDIRFMLAYLLRDESHVVETVSNARAALQLAARQPFDLFIIDTWLPDIDGNSLCRRLREFEPYTPVIVYSGVVFAGDQQAAEQAEADAFVRKPEIFTLLERVRYFLGRE